MTSKAFQRARSPEHKAQRQTAILEAAARVLERDGIDATTLNAIARETGQAKSNLYRYFESREDILIALLGVDAVVLIDGLCVEYATLEEPDDLAAMARLFARACARSQRFCLLISQTAPILEKNISVGRIVEIKRGFTAMLDKMGQAIYTAAPSLGEEGAHSVVRTGTTFVSGLWPAATPTGHVAEALEHPEISHFRQDFETELADIMLTVMTGLQARA